MRRICFSQNRPGRRQRTAIPHYISRRYCKIQSYCNIQSKV